MIRFESDDAKRAFRDRFLRLSDAHDHLLPYVRETVLSQPGYVDGMHIHTICDTIETFLRSDRTGLAISMPPRHMKSTIGAECLPAWWLSNHPQGEVIIASYNQTQARKMSRACRQRFDGDMHRAIFGTAQFSIDAADEFQIAGKVNGRPSLIAAGVGSGLTGSGGDLIIIDDPVKDMEEADSQTMRDKVYDWYTSVASPRLSPGGHIILIMTRWHHDDLAGRILNDDRDSWDVLNLPAISDAGDALWPERFPISDLLSKKAAMGSRVFEALYQGRPTPLEGGMFKRDWIRFDSPLPASAVRCRYWDKAATHDDGDWTVGCLMSVEDGRYCIEDIVRLQGSPYEVQQAIRRTAERDGPEVRIRMEQEPGSSGVDVIDFYSRTVLQGYDFRPDKVTGDKQLRAGPMAAAMECGNLWMVRAPWNRALTDELLEFPLGAHDDQVDACSGAFRELSSNVATTNAYFF
jgi:predicted phage terminase large subunit-like protein